MKILFRVDSSVAMGTGHVMRCLTLADQLINLAEKNTEIFFICRKLQGNLCDLIERKGYKVFYIPFTNPPAANYEDQMTDAKMTRQLLSNEVVNLVIVDHYALDETWEKEIQPCTNKMMVIDDLADRTHYCDLILDQNYFANMELRYTGLIPSHCSKLLGPKYALIRQDFLETRRKKGLHWGAINHIFIFFGGSDPTNETKKALDAFGRLNNKLITADVVVGAVNPAKEIIKKVCSQHANLKFHCQVDNMAEIMGRADLALVASGSVTWERFCIGLPGLCVAVADNQTAVGAYSAKAGIDIYLGKSENVTSDSILDRLIEILRDPQKMITASKKAMSLVDGNGAHRVASEIIKLISSV